MCKAPTVYPRSLDPSQGGSGRRDLSRSKVPPEHDQLEAAPTIYRPDSRTGPEGKNYVESRIKQSGIIRKENTAEIYLGVLLEANGRE
jgi:hypothetical protein